MKKRLLFISLALVVVLLTMGSTTVLAKPEKSAAVTPFTGEGVIYVTYMPDPPIQQGRTLRFEGEVVEGVLPDCDWPELQGATFYSVHDSIVKVDKAGKANGTMHGTFTLTATDSTLYGTFHARISGTISEDVWDWYVVDEGVWKSTNGTGVFEGVKAWGSLFAELEFGPIPDPPFYTLVGPLTWEGKYISAKE